MKLLKIVSIFVFALIIGLNVNTKSVDAQTTAVMCPAGYTCTPIPCPAGYTCRPIGSIPSCPDNYACKITETTNTNPPTTNPPTTTTPCHSFNEDLMIGDTGDDVVALQNFLSINGFAIEDRGTFWNSTRSALIKYQLAVGIPGTGYFGPLTRARVNTDCGDNFSADIRVLSPNGGESFITQTKDNINFSWLWLGKGIPKAPTAYIIDAISGKDLYGSMLTYNSSIEEKQSGVLPSGVCSVFPKGPCVSGLNLGGKYKIKVCEFPANTNNPLYQGVPRCDVSDSTFTITSSSSPSPTPSSTLTIRPVIKSIQSKANPEGIVYANEKAYIYGTGLSGRLTIKIGSQEPQFVTTTGISDSYAEFVVPSRVQSAVVSVVVTNSSGLSSNFYEVKINVPNTTSPSVTPTPIVNTATTPVLKEIWTTGLSFRKGDSIPLNINPSIIPQGYSLFIEAWNENDSIQLAAVLKLICSSSSCSTKTSWKIPDYMLDKGDRQFVFRAILKKDGVTVNTVKTGKIYVSNPDAVVSSSNAVVSSPATQTSPATVSTNAPAPVSVFLSAPKSTYTQTEKIVTTLKVYNNTDSDITLNFKNGCPRASYVVGSYDSASSVICPNEPGPSINVMAKGSYSWQVVHDPISYKIPVGDQSFTATINATNKSEYSGVTWSASLPIKITNTTSGASVFDGLKGFFDRVF